MKKKKCLSAVLFDIGLVSTLSISASAYSLIGKCNGVGCEAQLNVSGNKFRAGTYASQTMAKISVTLDGESEWWADKDIQQNKKEAYTYATIKTLNAWSTHHADNNRGDDFNRSIGYQNGNFFRK
ncbi:hypothetical protein Z968_12330 [Clostridium novyi A str. 4552]|uniref:Bacteriocin n=1 Tax=Clostridium novyi A str. 4552 TaxID=1444289 RepID=A0A0A0I2S4_CLONO|nr:hypothetical protein [Clostridium novyi]KGM93980.1 hypothetical protein Z968_12330 [Clostridium novyi A str. 4552]